MSETAKSKFSNLAINAIPSLLTVAVFLWQAGVWRGEWKETVRNHELRIDSNSKRITEVEVNASTARQHIAVDDQRDTAMNLRVSMMESDIKALPRIEAKLDALIDEYRRNEKKNQP